MRVKLTQVVPRVYQSVCWTVDVRPSSLQRLHLSVAVTAQVTVIQMGRKHESSIYKLQLTAAAESHGQLMFKHSLVHLSHRAV